MVYVVDAGTRAVIFDKLRGIQDHVVGEGTHFRIPFIQVSLLQLITLELFPLLNVLLQDPIIIDVRSRPRTIHSSTGTKDLQMVRFLSYILQTSLSFSLS